jgi:hypothetical protein
LRAPGETSGGKVRLIKLGTLYSQPSAAGSTTFACVHLRGSGGMGTEADHRGPARTRNLGGPNGLSFAAMQVAVMVGVTVESVPADDAGTTLPVPSGRP